METISCNLCGNNETKTFYRNNMWHIVQCKKCGLRYLNPRPSLLEVQDLYRNEYFNHYPMEHEKIGYFSLPEKYGWESYKCVEVIERYLETKGSLLELGCACGFGLAIAKKKGWKVQGVDISQEAAEYGHNRFNLNILVGSLESVALPNDTFDGVIALQTLEHLPNPLNTLKEIRRVLKRRGMAIISVPNISSIDTRLSHKTFMHLLQPPYHFYHFTPDTIKKMANKAGFRIVKIEYTPPAFYNQLPRLMVKINDFVFKNKTPLIQSAQNDVPETQEDIKFSRLRKIKNLLGSVPARLFPGWQITIYLTK
jgi:SAM-dependent methyltransferase